MIIYDNILIQTIRVRFNKVIVAQYSLRQYKLANINDSAKKQVEVIPSLIDSEILNERNPLILCFHNTFIYSLINDIIIRI